MSQKFINVMVDTETVGLANDAGIWQIGAVVFGSYVEAPEFKHTVHPNNAMSSVLGFSHELATIKWQEEKNTENWERAKECEVTNAAMYNMAATFKAWLETLEETSGLKVRLWFKGVDFDLPKLQHLYKSVRLYMPWHYRNVMCCRTAFNLVGYEPSTFVGAHDALEDAKHQAIDVEIVANNHGWEL